MKQNIDNITDSSLTGNNVYGNNNFANKNKGNKDSDLNSNCIIFFAFLLSLVSLFISIIGLCISYPKNEHLGFDYTGIIVGILSLLITILIGWQIYNTININNELKKHINNRFNLLNNQVDRKLYNIDIRMTEDIKRQINDYDNHLGSILLHTKANAKHDDYQSILFYFKALICVNKSTFKNNLQDILNDLSIAVAVFRPQQGDFTKEDISEFINILKECKDHRTVNIEIIIKSWNNMI